MKQRRAMGVLLAAVFLASVFGTSGCASTTRIYTNPSGADVDLDGEHYLGQTPLELREMPWVWTSHTLRFSREGYQTRFVDLEGRVNMTGVAFCLCTGGLLLPALLLGQFPEELAVELVPAATARAVDLEERPVIDFN